MKNLMSQKKKRKKKMLNQSNHLCSLDVTSRSVFVKFLAFIFIAFLSVNSVWAASNSALDQQLRDAASEGNAKLVTALIDKGANIDAPGKYGKTPLMYAAELGKTDTIGILLSHSANVNARTKSGSTALTFAAENGHASVTAMLIQLGANVHDRTRAGWNSLMIAAKNGYDVIVAQLLEFGADVRSSDRKGNSAMMYAIQAGHPNVIKTLFRYSDLVAPCVPNNQGVTPLMAAIDNKQTEIIAVLLPVTKNLNFTDKYGASVLHYAVANNSLKVVKSLIALKNININLQDDDGMTVLHEAVEAGNADMVSFLLENSANKTLKNSKGQTAEQLANVKGNQAIVKLLVP